MTQAATAVEPRFRISQFNSELDNQPRHRDVTLDGVFRLMTNFRTRKHKKPAPCWSPAEYHADETRGAPGVKQVNVLVYDIDSGVTPAELQLLLGDLRYCLATTFSSTEEHWKLRLAIGLKTPIPAGHFDQVWVRGQMSLVNGNADEAAKDCSRIYFNASHPPGVTPFSVIHDGRLLDWRLLPSVRAASAHAAGSTGVSELPIGTRTLDFIANGAPDGEQRERAVAAARSLLSSGCSVEQTAGLLWQGFQQSPQRAQDPWLEADALKIAESIAASAPPPLRPQEGPSRQQRRHQARVDLSKVKITKIIDVKPEAVTWVWDKRYPRGKFVLLQGDPGLGKSLISTDLAACVSTGRAMPGEAPGTVHEPFNVVMLVNEDDLASTIRPRLDMAGADLERISIIEGQYDAEGALLPLNLADYTQLEHALMTTGAVMLIIDPLFGHLPAGISISKEEEIRHLLAPLIALVAKLGVVLVGIRHLNQSVDLPSQYRGLGAGVWTAQARSELSVMVDPTNDAAGRKRYVLGRSKGNLGIEPPVLTYSIAAENDNDAPYIVWGETPSPMTWDELIREAATARKGDSAVSKAQTAVLRVITEAGADGITWAEAVDIIGLQGHSEGSARRARSELAPDIVSRKVKSEDGQTQTRWYLLEHFQPSQAEEPTQEHAHDAHGAFSAQVEQVAQVETTVSEPQNEPSEPNLRNLRRKSSNRAREQVAQPAENGHARAKPEPPAWVVDTRGGSPI